MRQTPPGGIAGRCDRGGREKIGNVVEAGFLFCMAFFPALLSFGWIVEAEL
jgi:hypothetical protein